jgi:hypothetical protein
MRRGKTAMVVAVVGIVAVMPLGRAVAAFGVAPAPVAPAPTAAHPLQGLRRLTVATVPAVPGMQFSIDGAVFTADDHGVASTLVTKAQREAVRADRDAHLQVVTPVLESSPGVRARFTGWSGAGVYKQGTVPEEYQRATFDIDYRTGFSFASPSGAPIPAATVTSMHLTSSLGRSLRLDTFGARWLQGSRTTTGPLGLQSRVVSYRVDSVTSAGTNVVHRGQQQFFPSRDQQVTVELLYFTLHVTAHDALLGSATGSSVVLTSPDGPERTVPFSDGSATIRHLPRGAYHVTITGSGPGLSQKLTVSRTQVVDLAVVTWIDLALGALLVVLIVVGLLLIRALVRRRGARVEIDLVGAERAESDQELVRTP